MAIMTITLEDNEQGTVDQTTSFEGGFDKNSPAHQYAMVILGLAKDFADKELPKKEGAPKIVLAG